MVAVPEKYISIAILRLLEGEKSVVEGAGAIGLAALLSGLLPEVVGKKWADIHYDVIVDKTSMFFLELFAFCAEETLMQLSWDL